MAVNYFDNSEKIDEWLSARRSRFTSSENFKLNKDGTGRNTYIETKVVELTTAIWNRPEIDEVEALRHGKAYEYPAYQRYISETKNYSMSYLGDETPTFMPCPTMPEESGGTPDIANILTDGKVDYGAEVKSPHNPAYHFRRLKWRSMWDVKEGYPSCYTQIQDLIRITGAFGWDFISYDERQLAKSKQIIIIEIKPDRKFIDNLELRIHSAVKDKYKLLSEHMGTELKNRTDYINFIKS